MQLDPHPSLSLKAFTLSVCLSVRLSVVLQRLGPEVGLLFYPISFGAPHMLIPLHFNQPGAWGWERIGQ